VMPVSMRVAKFDPNTGNRLDNYESSALKNSLDPNLPVWVVVHGMDSSERTDILVELTKAIKKYPDMQVVTVNWEDAAKDGIATQDAIWTPAVGKWIAQQLMNLKVKPENIELKGWSHGSYVAQATAEEIFRSTNGQKVGSLVALDPAGNWPMLSGFEHKIIDFKKYADYSLAIESSWIAGSDELAKTADTYVKLNPLQTSSTQISVNHTLPVTFLAGLFDYNRIIGGKQMDFISLNKIMDPAYRTQDKGYSDNRFSGGVDFVVDVNVEERIVFKNNTYYTYPYASPMKMYYFDIAGIKKEIAFDGTRE